VCRARNRGNRGPAARSQEKTPRPTPNRGQKPSKRTFSVRRLRTVDQHTQCPAIGLTRSGFEAVEELKRQEKVGGEEEKNSVEILELQRNPPAQWLMAGEAGIVPSSDAAGAGAIRMRHYYLTQLTWCRHFFLFFLLGTSRPLAELSRTGHHPPKGGVFQRVRLL